jgi:hypothetical protein
MRCGPAAVSRAPECLRSSFDIDALKGPAHRRAGLRPLLFRTVDHTVLEDLFVHYFPLALLPGQPATQAA